MRTIKNILCILVLSFAMAALGYCMTQVITTLGGLNLLVLGIGMLLCAEFLLMSSAISTDIYTEDSENFIDIVTAASHASMLAHIACAVLFFKRMEDMQLLESGFQWISTSSEVVTDPIFMYGVLKAIIVLRFIIQLVYLALIKIKGASLIG